MSSYNKSGVFVRNDIIYVQGNVDGIFYRKSTKKKATKANFDWVKKNAQDILLQLVGKAIQADQEILFSEYGYKSLEINAPNRKENTNKDYMADYKRHILPHFGKWKLSQIRSSDIKAWQGRLHALNLSGKRINNVRTVFRGILQDAFFDELIVRNPFDFVKRPKIEKAIIKPFNISEVTLMINTSKGWFQNYLIIAFFTGMRIGEIIGLKWEDINFHEMYISVQRSISKGVVSTPKTDRSIREVEILAPVFKALKKQFKSTGLQNSYVFLTQYGEHYVNAFSIADNFWKPTLRMCGLDVRTLYQTRHTFASIMLQQGEEIAWISDMLGHTDIHTTLTKYARYIPRKEKRRAVFVDDLDLKVI